MMRAKIMKNEKINLLLGVVMVTLLTCLLMTIRAEAKPLDEIQNYTIMVEVNQDATLNMKYHVDWKVLDSDSEGPLTWVQIGVPNKKYVTNLKALSDNIKEIRLDGSKFRIDLDREYLEGETVSFDFSFTQNYLYQVNKYKDGYTVYTYTPGWFDDIEVDELVIFWEEKEIDNFMPAAEEQDGWMVWTTSLDEGDKFTIEVTYPNDAYGFDLSHSEEDDEEPWYTTVIAVVVALVAIGLMIGVGIGFYALLIYAASAGFSLLGYGINALSGKNKQITRTKIEYYDACPGCGGTREEGKDVCSFCGKSMIKSSETITEKQLEKEYKDAKKYTADGDYRYGDSDNEFIRVHTSALSLGAYLRAQAKSSSTRRRSGSSHHSSCAHSSCACACACACAGGGRAGCTTKDFYRTGLKLHYFKR